jgi:hypothetical protein
MPRHKEVRHRATLAGRPVHPVTILRAKRCGFRRPFCVGGAAAFWFRACGPFAVKTKPQGAENGGRVVAALRPAPSPVFRS